MYASDAERQKAYRLRATAPVLQPIPPTTGRRRRPISRAARLVALCSDAQRLRAEYESWLESLPETLQEGAQAERLTEAIDALETVVDLLSDIQPPRGFGLD